MKHSSQTQTSTKTTESSSSGKAKREKSRAGTKPISLAYAEQLTRGLPAEGQLSEKLLEVATRVTRLQLHGTWAEIFTRISTSLPVKKRWKPYDGGPAHKAAVFVKYIDHPGSYQVFDIGCGDGMTSLRFAEDIGATSLVHVDLGDNRDERAQHIPFTQPIAFRSMKFTVPTIFLVSMALHHMPDPVEFLTHLRNVMPPMSYILVQEHDASANDSHMLLNFEHFVYEFLEGGRTHWTKYDAKTHYTTCAAMDKILTRQLGMFLVAPNSAVKGSKYLNAVRNFELTPSNLVSVDVIEPDYRASLQYESPFFTETPSADVADEGASRECPEKTEPSVSDDDGKQPADAYFAAIERDVPQEKTGGIVMHTTDACTTVVGGGAAIPTPPHNGPNVPIAPAPVVPPGDAAPQAIGYAVAHQAQQAALPFRDLREAIKRTRVAFAPSVPVPVQRLLEQMDAVPGRADTGCAHPVSAAYRALAVRSCLKRAVPAGVMAYTLLDYYGGDRNAIMFAYPQPYNLHIVSAPGFAVQGDAARDFHRRAVPDGYDSFLIQDVFQDTASYADALTPAGLLSLCDHARSARGYVLLRNFAGLVGQDSDLYDEGLWVRDTEQRNLVHFSPDPTGVSYALHPDCQWLFAHRSYRNLSIADLGQFGPYKLFSVARDPLDAVALAPNQLMAGVSRVEEMRFTDDESILSTLQAKLYSWFPDYLSEPRPAVEWVDTRIYAMKAPLYASKVTTSQTRDSAVSAVHSEMAMCTLYKRMKERAGFWQASLRISQGTTRAVLYGLKPEVARAAVHDANVYRHFNERLAVARAGGDPAAGSWLPYCAAVVAFGALVLLRVNLSRMDSTSAVATLASQATRWTRAISTHGPNTLGIFQRFWARAGEAWGSITRAMQPEAATLNTLAIAIDACVIMPLVEETLRSWLPKMAFSMTMVLEPAAKLMTGEYFGCLLSLVFHSAMMALTPRPEAPESLRTRMWGLRVGIHMAWNTVNMASWYGANEHSLPATCCAASGANACAMSSMSPLAWLYGAGFTSCAAFAVSLGATWKSVSGHFANAPLRPDAEETLRIKVDGQAVDIVQAGEMLDAYSHEHYVEQGRIYPLLCVVLAEPRDDDPAGYIDGHSYPFVRPSSSPINLLNCLVHRTMAPLRETPDAEVWAGLHTRCRDLFFVTPITQDLVFEDAIRKMEPVKRRRLQNARDKQLLNGFEDMDSVSVSVKHNEVIYPRGPPLLVKPRAIVQLSPEALSTATVMNHIVTEYLHDVWSERNTFPVTHVSGYVFDVHFVFASGYNGAMLDNLFAQIVNDPEGHYFVVAGDDNWTKIGPNPFVDPAFLENDYTQYDSTQGRAALKADKADLQAIGFTAQEAKTETYSVKLPFNIRIATRLLRLQIRFRTEPQMQSGKGSTTWGNSSRNVKDGVYLFENLGLMTPSEVSARLGFSLKTRYFTEVDGGTFLKGWWLLLLDGSYHWLPLPSMVLKIGKILRNPLELFPNETLAVAAARTCYALASSPGVVPDDYPILGPFLATMKRLGEYTDVDLSHKANRIVVRAAASALDLPRVTLLIYMRYGIDQHEIEHFHRLLDTVKTLPTLLTSPVVEKLLFDYA